jgi:hypothetical protein
MVFLILMFWAGQPFGTLNDISNAVAGILSSMLAWTLYAEHHSRSPLLSQVALGLAVVGAILVVVGSVLVISRATGFVMAGWYSGIGFALIGMWLMAFCYSMRGAGDLPHNLVVFGLVAGAILAVGLLDVLGVIARIDSMDSLPPYLYVAFLGWLGIYVLFPIWTIWLGRILLPR